jgi:release factor glutamine methyltransferase
VATAGGSVTLKAQIDQAAERLGDRRECALLASLALQQPLSWIYAHGDEPMRPEAIRHYAELIARRAEGVPFAYLVGRREFYGRDFSVSPDTLIPRPETEHLVEWALALDLPENAGVADIGTGSGCIALTLAAERPDWRVVGTDTSTQALAIAEINRTRLGADNARLVAGNLFEPLGEERFHLVVSNPPYVADGDPHLEQGDVRHEPRIALTPGPDGLSILRRLIHDAPDFLLPGAWLLLEHGYDQAEAVRSLFRTRGFDEIESRKDLAGIERVTGGRLQV